MRLGYRTCFHTLYDEKKKNFDLLIGIDVIRALGGVTITLAGDVKICGGKEACTAPCVDELDFDASFDHNERIWIARWKWTLNNVPTLLHNQVVEYKISNIIRVEYERELQVWITNGWLIRYPQERLGPAKGLISLMAVIQHTKGKVHPVTDYCELNEHVDAFIADADVRTAKLREWHQQGVTMALHDLQRTYLQVWVH